MLSSVMSIGIVQAGVCCSTSGESSYFFSPKTATDGYLAESIAADNGRRYIYLICYGQQWLSIYVCVSQPFETGNAYRYIIFLI